MALCFIKEIVLEEKFELPELWKYSCELCQYGNWKIHSSGKCNKCISTGKRKQHFEKIFKKNEN